MTTQTPSKSKPKAKPTKAPVAPPKPIVAGSPAAWLLATRLATLPAAVVPVVVGSAIGYMRGSFDWIVLAVTLLAALFIQIGTNLANDYFDAKKGADTAERLGPTRVTQSGLLSPNAVRNGAILSFGLAAIAGAYLITIGGWPILVIGVLSIIAGVLYTAGPYPLGYNGLGDIFTFIFFGLVAVVGTAYLHTGAFEWSAVGAAIPVGMLVTAIIVVNNLRDAPTDKAVGKRTLAVIYGEKFARTEYALLVLGAYLVLPVVWVVGGASPWVLLAMFSAPYATTLIDQITKFKGRSLNKLLVGTGRLHLFFGLLLAIGLVLSRR